MTDAINYVGFWWHTPLLATKTTVASTKIQTYLLLFRALRCNSIGKKLLICFIRSSIFLDLKFCWTDSVIVLFWLQTVPCNWPNFDVNQVSLIVDNMESLHKIHILYNIPRGPNIFVFLHTYDTNINNVRSKERKNAFSCLSALSEAVSRHFFLKYFCISIIHSKKNLIQTSIHYDVLKFFHIDIFWLVNYCHPLQWVKFTALFFWNFKWNISIIPKSIKCHDSL